ncbi:hypothetical protein AJ80_08512 [Polytolypa hystricis UAMH7299]|uniref:Rhodanese domain-containing protein n=1 Tax=Polytolypa hystricis (strain UAMH7299) TaxID=1447883 RepID=A0A2B7X6D5_POLH7|nr:hypothetical protein AJ80_08512 [Polytolypa hystricis UAMH7299]
MSSINITTLPRMTRETLSSLLSSDNPSSPNNLAIIDVRDSDHIGGHIRTSTWIPSSNLDIRMPELLRTLQNTPVVVFHCALSQQRGPSAALRYIRERERARLLLAAGEGESETEAEGEEGKKQKKEQEIYVLDGGFVKWQEKFGDDEKLTEAYVRDIWLDY